MIASESCLLLLMNPRICLKETNSSLSASLNCCVQATVSDLVVAIPQPTYEVFLDSNAKRIIQENNTLTLVTGFLRRVDDIAAKSEATRVLTNLVKTVWVQNNNNELRMQVMEAHIMEPIIELVRTSKFAVLKNDGIMALTLIFSESSDSATTKKALSIITADPPQPIMATQEEEGEEQKEHESRSFLQVLVDDICVENNEIPVQIKCNACVLLCKVVESAKKEDDLQVVESIKSIASDRFESIQDNSDLHKYATTLSKALQQ